MGSSLYIRTTLNPIPEKQFALTLRMYDGIEVDKADIAFFGYVPARRIALTDQVGWETSSPPTLTRCEHCQNAVTGPCVSMEDLESRAKLFPKSACVKRLAVAEALFSSTTDKGDS